MAKKGKTHVTAPAEKPKADKPKEPVFKTVADNRRARFEYEIIDSMECGIELAGTEVKSMRQGKCNLQDAFARIEDGQVWLYNCHISPYDHGNRFNHEPMRKRRLLMHTREIEKLRGKVQEKGLTLVPLKIYFKRNWVKVNLALVRGKQLYDKRQTIAKRDSQRQLERVVRKSR